MIGNALAVHVRDLQFALMHANLLARVSECTQVNTEVLFAMPLLRCPHTLCFRESGYHGVTERINGHDAVSSLISQRGANVLAWCWN